MVVLAGGGLDAYITENIYLAAEAVWVATQGNGINDLRSLFEGSRQFLQQFPATPRG